MVAHIPEAVEYPMDFAISPKPPRAGVKEELTFALYDPQTGKQVQSFTEEHERLFHLFIVGADLDPNGTPRSPAFLPAWRPTGAAARA